MTDDTQPKPIELLFRLLSGEFEVLSSGNPGAEAFAHIFDALDENFVLHVYSGLPDFAGDFHGRQGIAEYGATLLKDLSIVDNTVETIGGDANFLVGLARSTLTGASDSRVEVSVCTVSRISNGKLVEAWQFSSSLNDPSGILRVLGDVTA